MLFGAQPAEAPQIREYTYFYYFFQILRLYFMKF